MRGPEAMRLYHAPPSYYSMIARLALAETGIAYRSTILDIHLRQQQFDPHYVRLNPNMTVPTLVAGDATYTDSRDILELACPAKADSDTQRWLDRLYAFPVEDLTMGGWLVRNCMRAGGQRRRPCWMT